MNDPRQETILAAFDDAKSRTFELSAPELYAAIAASHGTSADNVERIVTARDIHPH